MSLGLYLWQSSQVSATNSSVQAYTLLWYEVQYLNKMWTEQMADILLKTLLSTLYWEKIILIQICSYWRNWQHISTD